MKKSFLFLSLLVVLALACSLPQATTSPASPLPLSSDVAVVPTAIPATQLPEATPGALPPSFDGLAVSFGSLALVLPPGLAMGASGTQFAPAEGENVAPWEVTPGHIRLDLDGYLLQGKFHQPQVFVYPAQGYAALQAGAGESVRRLQAILGDPAPPVDARQLPLIPFFNAGQVFASHVAVISFQNGQGVRFLTEYAQYAASANNHDLFYQFQGLTGDGSHYIIAILPITAPVLAESSDAAAPLPAGGIACPDIADPNADWPGYYAAVTALLNATPAERFAPGIGQLDLLIQSIRVAP